MRRALPWVILGVSLAGLLAIGSHKGLLSSWSAADRPYSEDHRRLLASLGPARPIEGRLSGKPSHKPYHPPAATAFTAKAGPVAAVTRGEAAPPASSERPFPGKVALAIERADERDPSPENRAALAVLYLVQGHPESAVPLLRKAHDRKPEDPRFLNDLSAALLAVSEATADPWPALEAVEMAQQSVRLEPAQPALFNLALALERCRLPARATAAWNRYLDQDSRSAWAQEAAARRDRLAREAAADPTAPKLLGTPAADLAGFPDNPWADRQLAERVLFLRWAEQTLAGRTAEAEAALAQVETLATALQPGSGRLLLASATAIREAEQAGDRGRLDRLAHGHQAFGQAFLLWREERASDARKLVEAAIRDLHAAGSPFELRARLLRAWMVDDPDWEEIRQLDQAAEAGGFLSLIAETRRVIAYRITLEGRLEAAADVYRDSRVRFEDLGEREGAAIVSAMRVELLATLGQDRESTSELATALAAGPWVADPWDRYSIYVVAAGAGAARRFGRAAVELRLEAADACRDLPERPLCGVDSWLRVAALTPDADLAEDSLHRAGDLLARAPDSDGKIRTEIDLTEARALRLAGDDRSVSEREEAAEGYGTAAERYEKKGLAVSAARARAARARILQRLGRVKEAAAEYRTGLRNFRLWDQSDRFQPERAEKRSPGELREVYLRLLDAELELAGQGPSPAAFLLSEEMRDRLAPRRSAEIRLPAPADLDRFAAAVPPGIAVVEYAVSGVRPVAWILAGGRMDQVALTPSGKLGERIRSLALKRTHDLAVWKQTSGKLFQELLAPVLVRLPAGTQRLVLVPDADLYGLPFRALWNPAAGGYLDESYTLELAPSVRQLLGEEGSRTMAPASAGPRRSAWASQSFFRTFTWTSCRVRERKPRPCERSTEAPLRIPVR